jgi:hypothetical protein
MRSAGLSDVDSLTAQLRHLCTAIVNEAPTHHTGHPRISAREAIHDVEVHPKLASAESSATRDRNPDSGIIAANHSSLCVFGSFAAT